MSQANNIHTSKNMYNSKYKKLDSAKLWIASLINSTDFIIVCLWITV